MKNWLNQHAMAMELVVQRLKTHWLNTLTICMVIGITATLPGLLFVGLDNLQDMSRTLKQDAQISAFLKPALNANLLQRLIHDLEALPQVKEVRYVPKEEAIKQLTQQFVQKDLLADLPQNPLPDALFITLQDTQPASVKPVQQLLQKRAEIEELVIDNVWIERLHAMLVLGKRIAVIFASLLGIAMITVISNTVRMQVLTHEAEIEVSRLIGATHSFIRRPFLYMGGVYGLGGGLIAVALLFVIVWNLKQPVQLLANNYQSQFQLVFHLFNVGGLMLITTVTIGWIAAFIALTQKR
ncbi:permease-like cell division protein FtsX [Methylophilus medardicus]|uniref:Cell division protein FtsX n=1 Tax=Methylophilus medardicus TaxID=2588534 RepID=A0A5B8CQW9_9PROT|nr:permease-like cell division protein FtsX [Methylophilus medardicus]QDC43652.1 ABC transporter permease [Methylophilus medardicus]QDC48659.1 ABC transporter permease [Methylophilus medardicus]QDC52364.1 ABC transporter permease [Methylophilus medardicus]